MPVGSSDWSGLVAALGFRSYSYRILPGVARAGTTLRRLQNCMLPWIENALTFDHQYIKDQSTFDFVVLICSADADQNKNWICCKIPGLHPDELSFFFKEGSDLCRWAHSRLFAEDEPLLLAHSYAFPKCWTNRPKNLFVPTTAGLLNSILWHVLHHSCCSWMYECSGGFICFPSTADCTTNCPSGIRKLTLTFSSSIGWGVGTIAACLQNQWSPTPGAWAGTGLWIT